MRSLPKGKNFKEKDYPNFEFKLKGGSHWGIDSSQEESNLALDLATRLKGVLPKISLR